jgi:TRAP-type C4-dicarboxylate transport system permease small subunit
VNFGVNASVPSGSRWRSIAILACVLIAILSAGWLGVQYVLQSIRISFAAEQIQLFDWSLENAMKGEPSEAVAQLQDVRDYYTSGSKQATGSFLDRMVETHRASVIREIIAHLRSKTRIDLGADPQAWIDRYGSH